MMKNEAMRLLTSPRFSLDCLTYALPQTGSIPYGTSTFLGRSVRRVEAPAVYKQAFPPARINWPGLWFGGRCGRRICVLTSPTRCRSDGHLRRNCKQNNQQRKPNEVLF